MKRIVLLVLALALPAVADEGFGGGGFGARVGPTTADLSTATGTLPVANGGTNSATALSGSTIVVSNGSAIVQGAAGTTVTVLHGNASGAPTYSAVSLVNDVTGTLPIAKGGTNSASALSGSSIMVSNGSAVIQGAAGTSTTLLHGNASGTPTYSAVSLTADVTGTLPVGNGGTGATTLAAADIAQLSGATFSGNVAINGNTTIGDASGDSFTVNANTVTFNNSTTISTASTKTLSITTSGAGSTMTFQTGNDTFNFLDDAGAGGNIDFQIKTGATSDVNALLTDAATSGAVRLSAITGIGTTTDRTSTQQTGCFADNMNATGAQTNLVCGGGEGGFWIALAHNLSIASDGNAGTLATSTTAPTSSVVLVTCNDPQGCNYNPAATSLGSTTLWFLRIVNVGTNNVVVNDASTVEVTGAASKTLATDESISCNFDGTKWSCG